MGWNRLGGPRDAGRLGTAHLLIAWYPSLGLRLGRADSISQTGVWESANLSGVAQGRSTTLACWDSADFTALPHCPRQGNGVGFQSFLTLGSSQLSTPGNRAPLVLSQGPGAGGERAFTC